MLTENAIKSAWVSIPFIYPPKPIYGIITAGLGTPSRKSPFVYPTAMKTEILRKYPNFDVDFNEDEIELSHNIENSLAKIHNVTDASVNLFKDLVADRSFRVVGGVFRALDVIQHYLINSDNLRGDYEKFDQLIQNITKRLDENDVLIVCSDHGFRNIRRNFYINNWLEEAGLLHFKSGPVFGRLGISAESFQKLLVKAGLKDLVWKVKRSSLVETVLRLMPSEDYLSNVDWSTTRAYYVGNDGGAIFANVNGREPAGIVERGEDYEELTSEIVKKALEIADPVTGEKVIRRAYRSCDAYVGELDNAPDILLVENEGYRVTGGYNRQRTLLEDISVRPGDHSTAGILFMLGNCIRSGYRITDATVQDITPTILHLLGIPIPIQIDGKPLVNSLRNGQPTRTLGTSEYPARTSHEIEIRRIMRAVRKIKQSGRI
jgi:predicted AlkP superfamily phosphohydrolase/phosphomutase